MIEHERRPDGQGAGEKPAIRLKFWGTRGSIPCSGAPYLRYGGNTACVEVRCGDHLIVLDGGTGIRDFGEALVDELPTQIDVLLTHCHFDHICGLPFFAPMHMEGLSLRLWAGHFENGMTTKTMLATFMRPPFFPVTPIVFRANIEYCDFRAGDTLSLHDDVTVRTVPLHHPQGATGYRIDHRGVSVCYLTDTAVGANGIDPRLIEIAGQADILIVDSMFTDEELSLCAEWGHASWRQSIEIADAAGAETLILFHHHPMHDDTEMDIIADEAAAVRPGTIVARQHMTFEA